MATLLSGGNPQIAKGYGDAPVADYLAAIPGWKQPIGRRLDALIVAAVPNVVKAVKWNSPLYGLEGQGWFLSLHCYTRFLRVTFFQGASLVPPPTGLSKYPAVRYFDIPEQPPFDEPRFSAWADQASRLPGETL
jgi:hypothetical protein